MKLSLLLTEFLYQQKKLNIPGIGHFFIDPSVTVPAPDDKNFGEFLQQIHFENRSIQQPDAELIDFIRSRTGKIKPLAESDLESFLADCKLLINIGKPLFLEGIGTLIKKNSGQLEFTPGAPASERVELYGEESTPDKHKERKHLYNSEYTQESSNSSAVRKIMIIAGILIGLVVIVWGGYLLYSKNTTTETEENTLQETAPAPIASDSLVKDTTQTAAPDTVVAGIVPPPVTPAKDSTLFSYKFVLQRTSKKHIAESNFEKVKLARPDLRMESRDSTDFKIFLVRKCLPSDTTRIKQELNIWYWGKKEMKVYIEN